MNLLSRCHIAASALAIATFLVPAHAAPEIEPHAVSISQMAGTWRMTFSGFTGCGLVSMLMDVTLAADGTSTNGTLTQHGQCGDVVLTGQAFRIETLASNGAGTAAMGCGEGCGWNLTIQVSRNRQMFNIVDVAPVNPGNYISGTAVRQ